jgi:4-hydroxy-tetrahydrodipicolinate synthase
MNWRGVFPAITTPFRDDLTVDHEFLARHVDRMIRAGCTGLVPMGSLGESATLEPEEKRAILATCRAALAERAPLVAGIAALSTAQAVATARLAHERGCDGLMVLPPYVYRTDARETAAHFSAVLPRRRCSRACSYNNPVAYGTDVSPEALAELAARHPNPRGGQGVERGRPPRQR